VDSSVRGELTSRRSDSWVRKTCEFTRLISDNLVFAYKIIFGLTDARVYYFPVRVVTLWNRLPAAAVLAQNLKQFKNSINEY